jgi:hypothetical protein
MDFARPVRSLGKMLHQIREQAKGGLDDICCSAFFRCWPRPSIAAVQKARPLSDPSRRFAAVPPRLHRNGAQEHGCDAEEIFVMRSST